MYVSACVLSGCAFYVRGCDNDVTGADRGRGIDAVFGVVGEARRSRENCPEQPETFWRHSAAFRW